MGNMKDWIIKNINPPGIKTKNRGSLFSAVGKIFGIVRDDATAAFNAHFPYLADAQKLARHGKSLSIPRLEHDTEQDYRERVAAASFYLMRSGERAYIVEQLTTHFGADHYMLWDEFLRIYTKVLDPSDDDRAWAYSLLDRVVNPNIFLSIIDWLIFNETIEMADRQAVLLRRQDQDVYPSGLRCDGRILCDQGIEILCDGTWLCDGSITCQRFIPLFGTISNTVKIAEYCNGFRLCDGTIDCSGYSDLYAPEDIALPLLSPEHRIDSLATTASLTAFEDSPKVRLLCDGKWLCDGSNRQSFIDAVSMPMRRDIRLSDQTAINDGGQRVGANHKNQDRYRLLCNGEVLCNQGKEVLCNGEYFCDGSVSCQRFISLQEDKSYTSAIETTLTLAPMADQARVNAPCDGPILCDGGNQESFADAPMTLRLVRRYWCDGRRDASCTPCDGSFECDGSRACFDGWYCEGYREQEEVTA
jgi:hypothetical protein